MNTMDKLKKVIVIPDSFKGTMSSNEICDIMEESIHSYFKEAEVIKIPVADGGEGTVDAFLSALGGTKKHVMTKSPIFHNMKSFYGQLDFNNTAIIEMAACAGLPLMGDNKNPMITTTYGVGELIKDALDNGYKKIIVGLGGSATNDAGTGAAAALGAKFYNTNNEEFIPVGGTLKDITKIDLSSIDCRLKETEIITMCDIDNPLYGKNGAAYVFAPQKGATDEMVKQLDIGLINFADIVKKDIGIDISKVKGSGAAGGMGGGMVAFFNSKLQMGIEAVLDTVDFDEKLSDCDMVFSGEGKIDSQSIRGKVVIGIAQRTKAYNVPLIAIVGDIDDDIQEAYERGVTAIFSINRVAKDFRLVKNRAKSDLRLTMDNLINFIYSLS